jgi:hypothetical protein
MNIATGASATASMSRANAMADKTTFHKLCIKRITAKNHSWVVPAIVSIRLIN